MKRGRGNTIRDIGESEKIMIYLARIFMILGSDIHVKPFPPRSSSRVLLSARRCKRNATIH